MADESNAKQAGATGQQQSGHDRQQQAYQRDQGQQGGAQAQQGGGRTEAAQSGASQRQNVQVGQSAPGGAMQQRSRGGLARYQDPFSIVQQLTHEMDQLFDSFFYGRPASRHGRHSELRDLWAPEIEVREEENQLRVSVDLPGISKENVKVDIHDGMLTIQGERREERSEGDEKQGYRRSERRYGSFYRNISLPEGTDAEHAQAQMKEGVLEITLPLTQRARGRRLEIKS